MDSLSNSYKSHGKHAKPSSGLSVGFLKRHWKTFVFYAVITLVYFARGFLLESDLPPWGVIAYQPIDEGTYANLALNFINFGSINPNDFYAGQYEFLMQSHVICNVVGNFFTALSLLIFGDNYFGLRMGVVFIGYLILILFCLTLKELRKIYGAEEKGALTMAFLLVVTLLASFVFFNATKAVEPSISRLLLVQLTIYCLIKPSIPIRIKGFLVGFFVFVSIFFVYVTNLFIGIPVLVYAAYVFLVQGKRTGGLFVLFGLLGAGLALLLAGIYYWCIWDTTPIANAINSVLIFESSGQSAGAYAMGAENLLRNVRAFFLSNTLFYLLPIAGIVFVCLIPLFKQGFKATGSPVLVLLMTVIGFFAQTVVSDDFVLRKAVVILPALLLLFYCCYLEFMRPNRISKLSLVSKIIICLATGVTLVIMVYATYYRLFRANSPTFSRLDYSDFDVVLLLIDCALSSIIVVVFAGGVMARRHKIQACSLFTSILICIVVNVVLVLNYNILNQTYTEKEAMIELGEVADGKIIAGEYENGFTLYNDILPLLNTSETLAKYIKENPDLLYFDYSNARSFSKDPDSIYQQIKEVERFERAYQTFGKKRSVSLYEFDE